MRRTSKTSVRVVAAVAVGLALGGGLTACGVPLDGSPRPLAPGVIPSVLPISPSPTPSVASSTTKS